MSATLRKVLERAFILVVPCFELAKHVPDGAGSLTGSISVWNWTRLFRISKTEGATEEAPFDGLLELRPVPSILDEREFGARKDGMLSMATRDVSPIECTREAPAAPANSHIARFCLLQRVRVG